MSKSNAFERSFLSHVLLNQAIANVGDAGGLLPSATAGNLYVALHTADPGEAGTAATNEATYTGYARATVARSGAGFTVDGADGIASFAADVPFPQRSDSGATEVLTHFSITVAASGASVILWSGLLSPAFHVDQGETPSINAGQVITED